MANVIEEKEHAPLSPSSMERYMACTASIIPIPDHLKVEKPESDYARFGTVAHAAFEYEMKGKAIPEDWDSAAVEQGLDFCKQLRKIKKALGDNILQEHIEARVRLNDLVYGTLDWCVVYKKGNNIRLYLADLKTGRGKGVAAFQNQQLMTYAIAAIGTFVPKKDIEKVDQVTIAIYQPNNQDLVEQDLDQWVCRVSELKDFAARIRQLTEKAEWIFENPQEATRKYPEIAGNHCQWCPRKAFCVGYTRYVSTPAVMMLDELPETVQFPTASSLSDAQIGAILLKADLVRDFLKSVEEYAHARFEAGNGIPGFKLVLGRTRRMWMEDTEFVESVLRQHLKQSPYKQELMGITEVSKVLKELGYKKSEIDEVIGSVVTWSTPPTKIVHESEPGEPVQAASLQLLDNLE